MVHQQEREQFAASSSKQVAVDQESVTTMLLETNEALREIQRYCEDLDGRTLGDPQENVKEAKDPTPLTRGIIALAFEARSQARSIMEFLGKFKERL